MDLLKRLAKKLNFSFVVHLSEDGSYGSLRRVSALFTWSNYRPWLLKKKTFHKTLGIEAQRARAHSFDLKSKNRALFFPKSLLASHPDPLSLFHPFRYFHP